MKWALYTLGALLLVAGISVAGYALMPNKASWAENFTAFSQSLPAEDPLKKQLNPLLSDGKLSLWELSQIHCHIETACAMDNLLASYTHIKSVDIFAATTLAILKSQSTQSLDGQQNREGTGSGT